MLRKTLAKSEKYENGLNWLQACPAEFAGARPKAVEIVSAARRQDWA